MDYIIPIIFFVIIVTFGAVINENFSKILKYERFSINRFKFGLGWFLSVHVNKQELSNFEPELQILILKGKKIAKLFYLTLFLFFLSVLIMGAFSRIN